MININLIPDRIQLFLKLKGDTLKITDKSMNTFKYPDESNVFKCVKGLKSEELIEICENILGFAFYELILNDNEFLNVLLSEINLSNALSKFIRDNGYTKPSFCKKNSIDIDSLNLILSGDTKESSSYLEALINVFENNSFGKIDINKLKSFDYEDAKSEPLSLKEELMGFISSRLLDYDIDFVESDIQNIYWITEGILLNEELNLDTIDQAINLYLSKK